MSIPVAIRTKAAAVMEGYEGLGGFVPSTNRYIPYEGKADKKGVWTIGRGHVLSREQKTSRLITIKGVQYNIDKGLTLQQVDDLFEQDILPRFERVTGMYDGETDDQAAAMLSGYYNLEEIWWTNRSPGKAFKKKDWKGVARGILMYTMSNGQHQLGLWRRRMTEALLFLTGRVMIAKSDAAERQLFNELKKHLPDLGTIRKKKFGASSYV